MLQDIAFGVTDFGTPVSAIFLFFCKIGHYGDIQVLRNADGGAGCQI